jgi:ferric-chelate reductase
MRLQLHALDSGSNGDEAREQLFNTGNPTMSLEESALRSPWYATTAYTGGLALLFMVLLAATALPYVRRNHFNTFYYFHVASSLAIFIMASVHASTDFYLLLPGLILWMFDWARRFFNGRQEGLHVAQPALVEAAGHGWYRISLPARTIANDSSATALEMGILDSPLAYYYLNFPVISRTQNHPFTAATPSSSNTGPVFLFQPSQGKDHVKLEKEWTWKLASSVGTSSHICLEARVEGPYQPRATQFEVANHIICIVGGTGFTGAHSLAQWWLRARAPFDDSRFSFVWTVRQAEGAQLKEWSVLEEIAASNPRLALTTHVSSEKGRLDPLEQMRECLGLTSGSSPAPYQDPQLKPSAWVYCAGPDSLIRSTHAACFQVRQEISRTIKEEGYAPVEKIDWHMAKWHV